MSSPARLVVAVLALSASSLSGCSCNPDPYVLPHRVDSFAVSVHTVQTFNMSGVKSYASWSPEKPIPMPRLAALLEVEVKALDENGKFLDTFQSPVSFRCTPGAVVATSLRADTISKQVMDGNIGLLRVGDSKLLDSHDGVARGFVLVEKVFGPIMLWAQDAPPPATFALPCDPGDETCAPAAADASSRDVGVPDTGPVLPGEDAGWVEPDGGRFYAAGVSVPIPFEKPLLADTQLLPGKTSVFNNPPQCKASAPGWSNKESPFVANFLTVEAAPPRGDMIVTAITAEGFYTTDKLAKPIDDPFYTSDPTGWRTMPSSFGHMYVYNYNFPDGLFTGDRILALTGTVQEFSGDTQFVFPSWIRKEDPVSHPEDRPAPVLLDFADDGQTDHCTGGLSCDDNSPNGTLRCVAGCGQANCQPGELCDSDGRCSCNDASCGASIPGAVCDPSTGHCVGVCSATKACAAGQWCVQKRCVSANKPCATPCPTPGERCNPYTGACECGSSLGYRVSKTSTWIAPTAADHMDQLFAYSNNNIEIESLESSIVKVTNAKVPTLWMDCDSNGNSNVPPFSWYVPNGPDGCPNFNASQWYCYDSGDDTRDCECNKKCLLGKADPAGSICTELTGFRGFGQWIVQLEDRFKTRMLISTRDALPDFDPREFQKAEYAGCKVDLTGVLRQVQAARPRWLILARDEGDFCCRAEAGAKCPTKDVGGHCPKCPDAQH